MKEVRFFFDGVAMSEQQEIYVSRSFFNSILNYCRNIFGMTISKYEEELTLLVGGKDRLIRCFDEPKEEELDSMTFMERFTYFYLCELAEHDEELTDLKIRLDMYKHISNVDHNEMLRLENELCKTPRFIRKLFGSK